MTANVGCLLGVVVGAIVGFVVGAAAYVLGYYLIFMLPQGEPLDLRYMDQAAIPVILFGPLGSLLGAVLLGLGVRRRILRAAATAVSPEQ